MAAFTGPPRGWDRWARVYHGLERLALGGELADCRATAADALSRALGDSESQAATEPSRHCLVLGDGDGRGLECLLGRNPGLTFTSVDISQAMIRRARRRIGGASGVTWVQADIRTEWSRHLPDGSESRIDAVVTQFFLDCFTEEELSAWWHTVARRVPSGGCWVVADFAPPSDLGGWRRLRQRMLLELLYRAFGWTTPMNARALPELDGMFAGAGWSLALARESPSGITRVRCWIAP
jgi:ubiquinone/menaquinone biosynthesis C-methylase UbiE